MAVKQWKLDKRLKRAVLEGDLDDARSAMSSGANCNHEIEVQDRTSTLLIQAALKYPELTQMLLDHGADVHGGDWQSFTALHHAWRPEIVAMLLTAGADPNARSIDRHTPLHFTLVVEKARLLLDAGADATLQNDLDQFPWESVQMALDANEPLGGARPEAIRSCNDCIDLLRSLADKDVLEVATMPVQMTEKEETAKAQEGRF